MVNDHSSCFCWLILDLASRPSFRGGTFTVKPTILVVASFDTTIRLFFVSKHRSASLLCVVWLLGSSQTQEVLDWIERRVRESVSFYHESSCCINTSFLIPLADAKTNNLPNNKEQKSSYTEEYKHLESNCHCGCIRPRNSNATTSPRVHEILSRKDTNGGCSGKWSWPRWRRIVFQNDSKFVSRRWLGL